MYSGGDAARAMAIDPILVLQAPPPPSLGIALLTLVAPVVGIGLAIPLLARFFRPTWDALDAEALEHQKADREATTPDRRPLVLFVLTAVMLTLQQYYDRSFFNAYLRPFLREVDGNPGLLPFGLGEHVSWRLYGELYGLAWWTFTRLAGYVALPLVVWRIVFPKDSLLDMGLRVRGLSKHAWIYGACLALVLLAVFIASRQPDFASYYPFYKKCSRSWLDLVAWESLYIAQFFGLELFFRGIFLNALRRSMGSAAIFAMCVPYCMIHFGKPYLETCGAILAGLALGSLSMRTKSIYSGFLVHVTVALLMDGLAIANRGGLPTELLPPDASTLPPSWN